MLHSWLTDVLHAVAGMALMLGVLALATSAAVALAGWQRRSEVLRRQSFARLPDRFAFGQMAFSGGTLDAATEAAAVLEGFEGLAAQHFVTLETAIPPDLAFHGDSRAIRAILGDLVACAIQNAPCGKVLLGAWRSSGRIHLAVSDDGEGADRALQASRLREAERIAGLLGATVAIEARPGQGTTALLHLPGATASRPEAEVEANAPRTVWSPVKTEQGTSSEAA